jgi:protocatechuate 3,4-dioxygenase beta subunit
MKVEASRFAAAALGLAVAMPVLARDPTRIAPQNALSSAEVAPADEPGERLEVAGVVYAADGHTPVTKASVYVYQTDSRGYYRPDDPMGNRNPRLMGLMRTDGAGRYSFRTIRPGSYPGTRVPRHIHYEVAAEGHGARIFEIVFDDDPFVTERIRRDAGRPGSFYSLKAVEIGPDAVGRVTQDVVLAAAPTDGPSR